jgi:SAM-dependent methyltransferase
LDHSEQEGEPRAVKVGDPSFWEEIAPIMFNDARWADAPGEVDLVLALLEVDPGDRILDLGCGPGRHTLELAERSYRVTGLDASEALLVTAARLAKARSLAVELVHEDMRSFCRPGGFEAVINMATTFGYFDDPQDDRRVLDNVRRSLAPGGRLLMELVGKEVVARTLRVREWAEEGDVLLLTEQHVRDDWTWVHNRLIFLRGADRLEFELSHRLYSSAELSRLLAEVGFESVQVFGSLSGASYDENAQRLVAVATAGT